MAKSTKKSDLDLQNEINKLRKEAGLAELDFIKLGKSTEELNAELKAAAQYVKSMAKDLSSTVKHIQELLDSADNLRNVMERTRSASRSIEKSAEDLYYHRKGIEKLSARELWSMGERLKKEFKMVQYGIKRLEQIKEKTKAQEKELELLKKIAERQGEINAKSKIAGVVEAIQQYTSLAFIFGIILKAAKELDEKLGKFAKSMNMSYDSAVAVAKSVRGLSEEIGIPTSKLLETYSAIGNALRSNALLNKEDLKTMTELREKAGLTNEELIAMQQYTFISGGFLKDNLNTFLRTAKAAGIANGIILNEKQLLQETAKVNKSILAQFTAMPDALGRSVAKAAELGTDLNGIDQTAKSLLNFEESISAELEAQALTGRQSNLDAARFYALTNQTEKLTEEIAKHFVSIGEWNEMTRLGQEGYAKSLGMTREDMAAMVVQATSLAGLSEEQAELARRGYDELVKKYGVERATEMVQKGGVDALIKQQSFQDRFNNSVETLKESLVLIVEGPLGTFLKIMNTILQQTTALKAVFAVVGTIMTAKMVTSSYTLLANMYKQVTASRSLLSLSSAKAIAEITAAEAITLGLATFAITAGIIAAVSAMTSAQDDAANQGQAFDDAIIGPAGGSGRSRILMGKEGVIGSFNDKDTITAGTNLSGGSREIVAAINSLRQDVQQPTRVQMSSDEVTAAVNSNNFRKGFSLGLT